MSTAGQALHKTADAALDNLAKCLSMQIANGWQTTLAYRQFCKARNVYVRDGVYIPRHPWPFPIKDPVQCDACGDVMSGEEASNSTKLVWKPTRLEAAVSVQVCPECKAEDSFQPADVCEKCERYPCCCEEANNA